MFLKVLSLVEKGYTIKKAIELSYGSKNRNNFYNTISEKQKQILRMSKHVNFPYFKYDDSIEEQIFKCKNNINNINKINN